MFCTESTEIRPRIVQNWKLVENNVWLFLLTVSATRTISILTIHQINILGLLQKGAADVID